MIDAIKNFPQQFAFDPIISGGKLSGRFAHYIVAGMGGSHLAADLLRLLRPELSLTMHSDYGLPALSDAVLTKSLFIASSYSGNTEETLDAFHAAGKRGLRRVVIAVGGALLDAAKREGVPAIQLPDTGIQPRMALGFSMIAFLKCMELTDMLRDMRGLVETLHPEAYEQAGKELALRMKGRVPVIYTSARYAALGYNWKIKCNETGKIPAFANVFPELNHNEMNGFDAQKKSAVLSKGFYFLMVKSAEDDARVARRMDVTEQLYRERALPVERITLSGETPMHALFNSLLLADWSAYYTATQYGCEAEQVPMIEQFKKLLH